MDILKFIGTEMATTVISITTAGLVGGIVWVLTLWHRDKKLENLLSNQNRKFDFYYRGAEDCGKNKRLGFLRSGKIGEGNNENEESWRINWGLLEIRNSAGAIYSQFKWDSKQGKLVHTNNPKLPSVMGQFIVPLFVTKDKSSVNNALRRP